MEIYKQHKDFCFKTYSRRIVGKTSNKFEPWKHTSTMKVEKRKENYAKHLKKFLWISLIFR